MPPVVTTNTTSGSAKKLISFVCCLFFALTGASLLWSLHVVGDSYREIALQTARSISETIIAVREWNASHGGLFAAADGDARPNPYLDMSERAVQTDRGIFTKINPAFMTRQIAELLSGKEGVQLRLISDRPINPANKPDAWEQRALKNAGKDKREAYTIEEAGAHPAFRYMKALVTEESCLQCHAKQGYKPGDIRGGLSITFSYVPFEGALEKTRLLIISVHGVMLAGVLSLILIFSRNLYRNIAALQDALRQIKTLEGLLPVCCNCGKIRVEDGDYKEQKDWVRFEQYISERTDADFSHGICPDCAQKLYPEVYNKKKPE
jgi:hypothetical protein